MQCRVYFFILSGLVLPVIGRPETSCAKEQGTVMRHTSTLTVLSTMLCARWGPFPVTVLTTKRAWGACTNDIYSRGKGGVAQNLTKYGEGEGGEAGFRRHIWTYYDQQPHRSISLFFWPAHDH